MKQITLNIIVFLISLWCCSSLVLATGRTNVNEVNDLFDRHIENKDQLMRDLQEQREGAVRDIETGKGLEHLEGIGEAESKARELESIREVDLESSGRQKRASEEYRFYDENELEPDYSKPGNLAHKRDADEIIALTGERMQKLGQDLQTKLSALGIDCRQVKGPIQKDLTYHIEIKGQEHKNSEYEQVFCEEPRNRYNCHDSLTVRCHKRGMQWGPWQDKTIIIPYQSIPWHWWIRSYFRPTGIRVTNSFNRFTINPVYHQEIAIYIASAIGVSLSQINVGTQDITVTHIAGALYPGYSQNVVSNTFRGENIWSGFSVKASNVTFHYQYRSGSEICVGWVDEWDEVCGLEP
jgi:hypothetical protein